LSQGSEDVSGWFYCTASSLSISGMDYLPTLSLDFSRTLPVPSQPTKSPHQEMMTDANLEMELAAPPQPGIDQSDAN